MNRREVILTAGAAVLAGCAPTSGKLTPGTKLILIRHADRAGDELNSKGRARAQAMVTALDGIPIDMIYAPDILRNRQTAAPLSQARGLAVTLIPSELLLHRMATEAAGRTAIWIGNKDNLLSTFEALGASGPAPVEYGDVAILEPTALGGVSVTRSRVEI